MEHYPQSPDVQWHACTLFGNLGLSLVLLVRLHLHPEIKHGRTALLIIRAIAEFPSDVRVQARSTAERTGTEHGSAELAHQSLLSGNKRVSCVTVSPETRGRHADWQPVYATRRFSAQYR